MTDFEGQPWLPLPGEEEPFVPLSAQEELDYREITRAAVRRERVRHLRLVEHTQIIRCDELHDGGFDDAA